MKVALVSFNPVVGDIRNNLRSIKNFILGLSKQNIDLMVFPELAVCGYPPRDLLDKESFVEDNRKALETLLADCGEMGVLVGFVDRENADDKLYNAAAYIVDGKIKKVIRKTLLPTYDIFDEDRYFFPSKETGVIDVGGKKIGVTICEDLWFDENKKYTVNPVDKLVESGIDYLVNLSASPYEEDKLSRRMKLISGSAKKAGVPILYVNQVGGNDGIIFDGGAVITDANGDLLKYSPRFIENVLVYDFDDDRYPVKFDLPDPDDDLADALSLGIRDYVTKCGFKKVVLGLSGGIDSALVATLAVKALGCENVVGVSMPSRFSSVGSKDDARKLAENLGIEYLVVPIEPMFDSYLSQLTPFFGETSWDLTEENIQARIRGNILMALSNKHGWLVLTTGNKSELAVGYCTLYGDMCGALAVISDLFKTRVYELSRSFNRECEVIPSNSITKPPSAELRDNQTDQDSLPDYDVLDGILKAYIEQHCSVKEIINKGFCEQTVLKTIQMVDRAEYKRRQAAPGLKISVKAFGEGRRIPIVQNYTPFDAGDI